jgi:hypothetical protein
MEKKTKQNKKFIEKKKTNKIPLTAKLIIFKKKKRKDFKLRAKHANIRKTLFTKIKKTHVI